MVLLWNYDGVLETLYHMLWLKEFSDIENKFLVNLSSTILFKNNLPISWYFSSKTGEILRKKKENINIDSIIADFNKNRSKSQIVAIYLYELNDDNTYNKPPHILDRVDIKKTISKKVMIDYISHENLRDFLLNDKKNPYGVLQKFVDPYGEKNFTIEAIWTPNMTIFTKKVNLNSLYYDKLELIEKASTVDSNEMYSEVVQIKGTEISNSLRNALNQIIRHIATVSFDHILVKRLICYLKIDKNQKIWFLWCGSCRTIQEKINSQICKKKVVNTTLKIHHSPLILSNFIRSFPTHKKIYSLSLRNPAEIIKKNECKNCNQLFVSEEMVKCSFERIVKSFDYLGENENIIIKDHTDSKLKNNIPNLIRKTFPQISIQDYNYLKGNDLFLQQNIDICMECFMDLTRFLPISGNDPDELYKKDRNECKSTFKTVKNKMKKNSDIIINLTPQNSIKNNIKQRPLSSFLSTKSRSIYSAKTRCESRLTSANMKGNNL